MKNCEAPGMLGITCRKIDGCLTESQLDTEFARTKTPLVLAVVWEDALIKCVGCQKLPQLQSRIQGIIASFENPPPSSESPSG